MPAAEMERRDFLKLAGVGVASAVLPSGAGCSRNAPAQQRPNILFICSDQHHARKVGYRGHAGIRTPNLDRLATGGAHFTRAYCNSPVCIPSRMSFFTGRYVHQIGVWLNGVKLGPDQTAWADNLARSGMSTSAFGKLGVVGTSETLGFTRIETRDRHPVFEPWPLDSPFDQRLAGYREAPWWLDGEPSTREEGLRQLVAGDVISSDEGLHFESGVLPYVGYYDVDREATDRSLEFLRGEGRRGPWVHFIGYMQPHWPFICPKRYVDLYDIADVDLPFDARFPNVGLHPAVRFFQDARPFDIDEAKLRRIIATYYGMITCMDDMIGEVLAELETQGLAATTYVVYTSDHGESLGEHGLFGKQTSYEGSVGVPLAIRGPGIAAGQRIDDPASLVDLYPTLLEMAGLDPTSGDVGRPGVSQLSRLQSQGGQRGECVFTEYHGGYFQRDWYMVTRGNLKYTYYAGGRPTLFDLTEDPQEMVDLVDDPAYGDSLAELDRELRGILDPDATAHRAKRDCGLIATSGEDYTETLSWEQLQSGRRSGRFAPRFKSVMKP